MLVIKTSVSCQPFSYHAILPYLLNSLRKEIFSPRLWTKWASFIDFFHFESKSGPICVILASCAHRVCVCWWRLLGNFCCFVLLSVRSVSLERQLVMNNDYAQNTSIIGEWNSFVFCQLHNHFAICRHIWSSTPPATHRIRCRAQKSILSRAKLLDRQAADAARTIRGSEFDFARRSSTGSLPSAKFLTHVGSLRLLSPAQHHQPTCNQAPARLSGNWVLLFCFWCIIGQTLRAPDPAALLLSFEELNAQLECSLLSLSAGLWVAPRHAILCGLKWCEWEVADFRDKLLNCYWTYDATDSYYRLGQWSDFCLILVHVHAERPSTHACTCMLCKSLLPIEVWIMTVATRHSRKLNSCVLQLCETVNWRCRTGGHCCGACWMKPWHFCDLQCFQSVILHGMQTV